MEKIQYGLMGFFCGMFTGFLVILVERRIIDSNQHPALLFAVNALTIFVLGIVGITVGLRLLRKKLRK